MSNRTMLEFNHDFAPTKAHIETWGMCIAEYLRSGDPSSLPSGVTFFGMRHHTQPCPMGDPPRGWRNDEPQTEKAPQTKTAPDAGAPRAVLVSGPAIQRAGGKRAEWG